MKLGTYTKNTWCSGCGNFGLLSAFKKAIKSMVEDGVVKQEHIVISAGIGCHAKIFDYLNLSGLYSIHGRPTPTITGMKVVNPKLRVVAFSGDGDAYGEGISHVVFAAKRNTDITLIVHNNEVYGLTTGQYTPTSPKGFLGRSTPKGCIEEPLNPLALFLTSGATFVARGYVARLEHLARLFREAILHPGFSAVDVLQPCVTFRNLYNYYNERVYEMEDHDPSDWDAAMKKAYEWGEKIPIGIFYQVRKPSFEEALLKGRVPVEGEGVKSIARILKGHL